MTMIYTARDERILEEKVRERAIPKPNETAQERADRLWRLVTLTARSTT